MPPATKRPSLSPIVDTSHGPPADWKQLTEMVVKIAEGVNTVNEKIGSQAAIQLEHHQTTSRAVHRLAMNQLKIRKHIGFSPEEILDEDDTHTNPGIVAVVEQPGAAPHRDHSSPEFDIVTIDNIDPHNDKGMPELEGRVMRSLGLLAKQVKDGQTKADADRLQLAKQIAVVAAPKTGTIALLKKSDTKAWGIRIIALLALTIDAIVSVFGNRRFHP